MRFPIIPLLASMAMAQSGGTFTATGNMTTPRSQHTATLLLDGRVLITGGAIGCDFCRPTPSAEIYAPSTGIFTPTGSMTSARSNHSATLLPDGRVLIVGGGPPGTAEMYDPSTGIFTATANLPPNAGGPAALLNDGTLLFLSYAGAALYDPSSGTFAAAGPRGTDGSRIPVLQPDGNVLLLPAGNIEAFAIELYSSRTNTFSHSAWPFIAAFWDLDITIGYSTASANLLSNGRVLITLHSLQGGKNNFALLLNPLTGFTQTSRPMLAGRQDPTATPLSDGSVLITGGFGEQCSVPPFGEVYDPVSDSFSATGSMTAYRRSYAANLLKDGRVLITGGVGCPVLDGQYTPLASAELFRPATIAAAPALLSLSGDGRGPGAIQHSDTYQLVSGEKPASAGEIVVIYCTGLAEGNVIPPQVSVGGKLAEVLWFGNTPSYAGLGQINVRLPGSVAGNAVPVHLTYLGRPSNEVTIAMR